MNLLAMARERGGSVGATRSGENYINDRQLTSDEVEML